MHVQRLLDRLVDDGFDVVLVAPHPGEGTSKAVTFERWRYLPRYLNHLEFLRGFASPFGAGLLHLHDNPIFFAPLVWLHILRGGYALITVHDEMIGRKLTRALPHEQVCFWLLVQSKKVQWIAVSHPIQEFLKRQGVPVERVRVVPAFLVGEGSDSGPGISKDLVTFLRDHSPSMVVYGYRYALLDGRDLYGFEFAVQVLRELVHLVPSAGLVLFCPDVGQDHARWESLASSVRSAGLEKHAYFLSQSLTNPFPVWRTCTVMLRPTLTDGDSVAVREMISLGKPVIASNVVPRPRQTKVLPLKSPLTWARTVIECEASTSANVDYPVLQDGYAEIKRLVSSSVQAAGARPYAGERA